MIRDQDLPLKDGKIFISEDEDHNSAEYKAGFLYVNVNMRDSLVSGVAKKLKIEVSRDLKTVRGALYQSYIYALLGTNTLAEMKCDF